MFSFLSIAARFCTMRFMKFFVYEWHASDTLRSSCWSKCRFNIPYWLWQSWENTSASKSCRIQAQKNDYSIFPFTILTFELHVRAESLTDYQCAAENSGLKNSAEIKTNTEVINRAMDNNDLKKMAYFCLIHCTLKNCTWWDSCLLVM